MMTMEYHNAVLLKETVDGLAIKPNGVYVDVTFGGGGHSKEMLSRLGPGGKLFAFDQDKDALANTIEDERFVLINENFRFVKRFLRFYGVKAVDGILADFGVSSHQFDVAERGFSTRFESDLDMRMNQDSKLSALDVVNNYTEEQLRAVLSQYGELRQAPAMAKVIVAERANGEIKTSEQLKTVLKPILQHKKENKVLAQIYQAIRIEVNQEIEALKELLLQTPELLKKGGRLSFISYHSLEDRLVKRYMRDMARGDAVPAGVPVLDSALNRRMRLLGKAVRASAEEVAANPRARSAIMRVAEKIN